MMPFAAAISFRPALIALAVLVVVVLGGGYWYGEQRYHDGERDLVAKIEVARARSVAQKEGIDDALADLNSDELLLRALDWVRTGR